MSVLNRYQRERFNVGLKSTLKVMVNLFIFLNFVKLGVPSFTLTFSSSSHFIPSPSQSHFSPPLNDHRRAVHHRAFMCLYVVIPCVHHSCTFLDLQRSSIHRCIVSDLRRSIEHYPESISIPMSHLSLKPRFVTLVSNTFVFVPRFVILRLCSSNIC